MGSVRRFAVVNTKVRALKGKLLTKKDYNQLLKKKSVSKIAEYLKENTAYRDVLKDIDIRDIHRGNLELLLKRYIVLTYEKLLHYFTDEYRRFFRIMFMRYEIEDIKLYLRALSRGENLRYIRELVLYSGVYSTINHDKIVKSKNIEHLVENLKDTVYYQLLVPFLNEKGQKQVFYMEMNLDGFYFRQLYEQASKLNKTDERVLKDSLGKNIDLLNLEWIYRGLKFYKLSPEELINYTLLGGNYLRYKDIKQICYSKDEEELKKRMINTKYGFLFDNEETLDLFMERRIQRYLYFQFLDYYRRSKMNIMQSIAFVHLLEYEIRDIISLTEAIRYGLDSKETKKYLIRRIEGSDA
ncbi:V-type ATPase subunit [Caldisalinibacter kiritimatiensis]|uniref:V-type ATP synthase subunit C n=1 Tax=Caldisalinibacter kiritimatiensis TaxID=1304284 RepID=R1AXJ1_9FIRM|nr:V-type ATPase subunit [Caldisalinibacter kiritimatiensis]EOD01372.1 V-type ATP synthase subunit C [Caldisalinibacter kiritimatiensis]